MSGFKFGKMTFGSLFKKPETVLYPVVKPEPPAGLKGHVEVDESTCILCSLCVKRCPCGAIEVDKKARTWAIDHFRCVQCGSCTYECPKGSLTMLPTYETVSRQKRVHTFSIPERPKAAPKREDAGE